MLEPVLSGIGFGLLLTVLVGPVFFTLLQTALHEGFRAGVHLAIGVLISDTCWIIVTYVFASQLDLTGKYKLVAGWIGGLMLMAFGLATLLMKVKEKEVDDNKRTVHAKFMAKGFLLNSLNPAVPLFWLGVITVVKTKENYSIIHEVVFFSCVLITVFSTDLFKSFIAHRLKKLLQRSVLIWVNRIVGLVLMGIGLNMILKNYY
jgi:threonine/homoserine/homoserine lactone efflux protein